MKIKFLIETKILIAYLNAKRDGYEGSYLEFVDKYIADSLKIKDNTLFIEDFDNIFKLTTLSRVEGVYNETECFYLERPEGMTQEEVFKVIAHNREYFERYYKNFDKSVCELTKRSLVSMYGFRLVSEEEIKGRNILPLYFVKEYDMYFINSHWFDKHISWYEKNKGLREEDIIEIYDKINKDVARLLRDGE